jgi:hypothetical protein
MRSSLILAALLAAGGVSASPLLGGIVGGLTCLLGQILVNGKVSPGTAAPFALRL